LPGCCRAGSWSTPPGGGGSRRTWHESGIVTEDALADALRDVAALDVQTHPVEGLLGGAWRRRHHLSLADALYVELARLDTVVVTTDHRLSRATPSRSRLPPERPRRS
jgi:predicted nucleic acid-binding protein